jgi:hypothetical protein
VSPARWSPFSPTGTQITAFTYASDGYYIVEFSNPVTKTGGGYDAAFSTLSAAHGATAWYWGAATSATTINGTSAGSYTDLENIQQIATSAIVSSAPPLVTPGNVVPVLPATVKVLSVTDNGDGTATWVFDQPGTIANPAGGSYVVTDTGMDTAGESAMIQIDPYTYIMTFALDPRGWPFTVWTVTDLAGDIDFSPHVIPQQSGTF